MNRSALVTGLVLTLLLAAARPAHAVWSWPLRGDVITTYRNGDDPYAAGQHRGIDVAGPVGADVVAATAGEVRFAGVAGSSGLTVSVRTADGRFDTSYLHLSATAVEAGERVAAGQRLGAVGVSGRRSAEAPHLHFGVREADSQRYHDPLGLLPPLATAPETRPQAPPVRTPLPAIPAPTAVPVPASSPRRVPAAAPRRMPVATSQRRPATAPRRQPVSERRRVPAAEPRGVPAVPPRVAPASESRRHPALAPRPRRLQAGRARGAEVRSARAGSTKPEHLRVAEPRSAPVARERDGGAGSSGPDAGWALACLGLLTAAALVGTSGGGRTAARRGRAVVRAWSVRWRDGGRGAACPSSIGSRWRTT